MYPNEVLKKMARAKTAGQPARMMDLAVPTQDAQAAAHAMAAAGLTSFEVNQSYSDSKVTYFWFQDELEFQAGEQILRDKFKKQIELNAPIWGEWTEEDFMPDPSEVTSGPMYKTNSAKSAAAPTPAAMLAIPFDQAYLCGNCEAIGNSSTQCPACASTALRSVSKQLGGPVERMTVMPSARPKTSKSAATKVDTGKYFTLYDDGSQWYAGVNSQHREEEGEYGLPMGCMLNFNVDSIEFTNAQDRVEQNIDYGHNASREIKDFAPTWLKQAGIPDAEIPEAMNELTLILLRMTREGFLGNNHNGSKNAASDAQIMRAFDRLLDLLYGTDPKELSQSQRNDLFTYTRKYLKEALGRLGIQCIASKNATIQIPDVDKEMLLEHFEGRSPEEILEEVGEHFGPNAMSQWITQMANNQIQWANQGTGPEKESADKEGAFWKESDPDMATDSATKMSHKIFAVGDVITNCPNCSKPIKQGEMVNWTSSGGEAHVNCPGGESGGGRLMTPKGFQPQNQGQQPRTVAPELPGYGHAASLSQTARLAVSKGRIIRTASGVRIQRSRIKIAFNVKTAKVSVSQGQDAQGFHMLVNLNGTEYVLRGADAESFRKEFAAIPKPEEKVNALVERYLGKLQPYNQKPKQPVQQPAQKKPYEWPSYMKNIEKDEDSHRKKDEENYWAGKGAPNTVTGSMKTAATTWDDLKFTPFRGKYSLTMTPGWQVRNRVTGKTGDAIACYEKGLLVSWDPATKQRMALLARHKDFPALDREFPGEEFDLRAGDDFAWGDYDLIKNGKKAVFENAGNGNTKFKGWALADSQAAHAGSMKSALFEEDEGCPECFHPWRLHSSEKYGCEADLGDTPGGETGPPTARGECGCKVKPPQTEAQMNQEFEGKVAWDAKKTLRNMVLPLAMIPATMGQNAPVPPQSEQDLYITHVEKPENADKIQKKLEEEHEHELHDQRQEDDPRLRINRASTKDRAEMDAVAQRERSKKKKGAPRCDCKDPGCPFHKMECESPAVGQFPSTGTDSYLCDNCLGHVRSKSDSLAMSMSASLFKLAEGPVQLVVMNGNYPMEVHARGCRDLNMPKYRRAPQDWIITGNTVEEAVKKAADELNSQFDDAYDVEDLFRVMPCCNKKTGAAEGYDKPVSLDPTPEDLKRWHNAIYSTYNAIGSDANLEGEKPAVILEVCLDAGHTEAYGGLEPEDYKRFQTWYRSIESKYGYQNGLKRLVKLLNITG